MTSDSDSVGRVDSAESAAVFDRESKAPSVMTEGSVYTVVAGQLS
ncbi:MAG: hypothetical protein OXD42_00880 [Rhodospirillaceae bacterium]|nr:hypothetical protein [Rhodospirillaceae bacterium]MCY4237691.1 hypothetical protein [Rhodospirillaceae bacterium]